MMVQEMRDDAQVRLAQAPTLVMIEQWTKRGAQLVSGLGVASMLLVAFVTTLDVVARWLTASSIAGFNEVIAMVFAVAVAATLPSGVAMRVNLKVDLLAASMGPQLRRWMDWIGSLLLVVFFALLAQQLLVHAAAMVERERVTTILSLPVGRFMYAVAFFVSVAALVQTIYLVLDVLRHKAEATTDAQAAPTAWPIKAVLVAFCVALAGLLAYAWHDLPGLSAWVASNPGMTVLIAFVALWMMLLGMMPVAAAMAMVGVGGCILFLGTAPALKVFASESVGFLTNSQVAALPLFLMMGSFAAKAGLADDVYRIAGACLGRFQGGLSMATIGGCAGFGAVTGSSLATTATFGRIAIPQMRAQGYSPALASGCVAAGGTLGALIPPSAPLILFALLTETSIGALFIAAMVPGLIAVAFYLLTVMLVVRFNPSHAPEPAAAVAGELVTALKQSGPVMLLFGTVLSGLYGGVFTATEAAAVGAIMAFGIAAARGKLNRASLLDVMGDTTVLTAMVYGLIFGALAFSYFVGLSQVPDLLIGFIGALDLSAILIVALILIVYLLLGSVMDSFAVMIITIPVVTPLILNMGFDLVWWGIIMLVVVETGLITPPFGINLFVMKSMQPDVPLSTVFRGAMPFVLADLVKLILLVAFPALVLWLPSTM